METPVLDLPDVMAEEDTEVASELPWNVILYNDDYHTFNDVIAQVQKATGVSISAAFELTMQVHMKGRANCYCGARVDCEKVAAILREIGLTVEVTKEEGA